jgi:hypothetical protein
VFREFTLFIIRGGSISFSGPALSFFCGQRLSDASENDGPSVTFEGITGDLIREEFWLAVVARLETESRADRHFVVNQQQLGISEIVVIRGEVIAADFFPVHPTANHFHDFSGHEFPFIRRGWTG